MSQRTEVTQFTHKTMKKHDGNSLTFFNIRIFLVFFQIEKHRISFVSQTKVNNSDLKNWKTLNNPNKKYSKTNFNKVWIHIEQRKETN